MSLIGITMGCPVGIGPEIILRYYDSLDLNKSDPPIVIGDIAVLSHTAKHLGIKSDCVLWHPGNSFPVGKIPVYSVSQLDPEKHTWGIPDKETGLAMASYIETGVKLIHDGKIDGLTTCPIAKISLHQAGYNYPGHTEMLAALTCTKRFAMMMAGEKLRVTLATIHCSFSEVTELLTHQTISELIHITHHSLIHDFGICDPRIAVAGLNPHGGEGGIFGKEEIEIIAPAIAEAQNDGINAVGPFPPDTIFHQAANGKFDTVVCMYHDQGLIPFKLLHFSDGVNITLGLPIVRTSVDHGTAYDIAGKGQADQSSLSAAVTLSLKIVRNRKKKCPFPF